MLIVLLALALLLVTGGPGVAYQVTDVKDGGTVQGKVSFSGTPPSPKKIIPTKDKEVCGGIRERELIVLGPDKAVQGAFVYLKSVEKGKAWDKAEKVPVIDNKKCEFEPHVQIIKAGEVAIHNSDPVLHNTHGFFGKRTVFNVALPTQGQTVKKEVKGTGLMRVECDAHGWMLSWVYVADNPYYALTGKDGAFAIKDVPPGKYTLVVWQAHTGAVERPIDVKAKEGASVTIDLAKK